MSDSPLLKMSNISMGFGDTLLFSGFNLSLNQNETVGITGPSGSGKSTILRIAVGLMTPLRGEITFLEKDIDLWNPQELRRRIILVPQEPAMFSGTVRENLLWAPSIHGIDVGENQLHDVLHEVNLNSETCLDKIAGNLSGGEKQRIGIARALLLAPEALLLDEPTSALDEESMLIVETSIQAILNERKIGVLIVTHNHQQASRFADRVVTIEKDGSED